VRITAATFEVVTQPHDASCTLHRLVRSRLRHQPAFHTTLCCAVCAVLCCAVLPADMMPKLRTDKGAIKFVLSGANIMCPGLTSPGATIHTEVRRTWSGDERGTGNAVTERHCWRDAN
jgi:hypothetical protein